ncbi:MAG TPA: hypothetical protein VLL72_09415 [Kiloniellales bacterium]|nr:hypothetical protein [Kiloniellales bacterium]
MSDDAKAAPTPGEAAQRLEALLGHLAALLDAETEQAAKSSPGELEQILADKRAAARDCRTLMQELAARPAIPQGFTPEQRAALEAAGARLGTAVRCNARVLEAELGAGHSLMTSIARAVEQERIDDGRYRLDGGAQAKPAGRARPTVLVNETA